MKKLILLFVILIGITKIQAQNNVIGLEESKLSVGGVFETVFDQYGNKYSLDDIKTDTPKKSKLNNTSLSSTSLCTSGIFELYFEDGSGMEVVSNPTQNAINTARRNVACQVFTDLSNFINTPLKNAGNTTKVKIWVRDINEVIASSNGVLGLATSFYNLPYNSSAGFGGIADNEIWKTIHAGKDSYINVATPIISYGVNSGTSGLLYHGMMAFNFNSISNWNTNLSINSPAGQYDLYSVILHEVTHALGFASLINANGLSKFGNGFKYYSRYDRFLKNNANTQSLITNTGCSLYNYSFNPVLSSSVLQPNPSSCITQQTTCSTAIKFVGTSTVPVYTPNCFEPPSSLSHFEDQCIGAPNGNNTNAYFTMTDANGTGVTKRFLKLEERNALGDIGYQLNTTFGNNTTALGSYNNYGGVITTGINVGGINDGINNDGTFLYTVNQSSASNPTSIVISNILENDYSATGFECIQDVFSTSTLSATSGNTTTSINFSSTISGLHLLRYVPINGIQKGNIAYIYVYVIETSNCAIPSSCNLVSNSNFEQYSSIPNSFGQISRACGWINASAGSPDYCHADTSYSSIDVPCNDYGTQEDKIISNKGYVRFFDNASALNNSTIASENFVTKLNSPLQPNTEYRLSFDVSLMEGVSNFRLKPQAYLSASLSISSGYYLPISNPNMLFTNPTYSNQSNGWERITFYIPSRPTAGEEYLYLGAIYKNVSPLSPFNIDTSCNYTVSTNNGAAFTSTGYYLDNVELIPLNSGVLTFPNSVCYFQYLPNLSSYLNLVPTNGTFLGNGVSYDPLNGNYSFNSSNAGIGIHNITYTYTNSLGCSVSLNSNIIVSACPSITCLDNLAFTSLELTNPANYQAAIDIVTNGNYIVNSGSTIDLKAGNSIIIDTDSWIKNGSLFLAEIEDCIQTSERSAYTNEENSFDSEQLTLFPNPANAFFTVKTQKFEITKIEVASIEGKIIYHKENVNNREFQLFIENYQNGIYLVSVETTDGKTFTRKLVKN